jgi:hypothetical protein
MERHPLDRHPNNFANEYASVAYWYQSEPHAAFPLLPEPAAVRPPLPPAYHEARAAFFAAVLQALQTHPSDALFRFGALGELFYAGRFAETLARLRSEQAR